MEAVNQCIFFCFLFALTRDRLPLRHCISDSDLRVGSEGRDGINGWMDGRMDPLSIYPVLSGLCLPLEFFLGGLGRLRKGCIHTAWSRQALCMMNDDYENAGVHGRYK